MEIASLKRRLQDHFTDGLALVVGSGLSVAEGLPTMPDLGRHLRAVVTPRVSGDCAALWDRICAKVDSGGLEAALLANAPTPGLEALIVEATADLVREAETTVIQEVVRGDRELRLTQLFPHLLKPDTGIPIVTTNYDRLIEVAAEAAGLGVDSLFVGHYMGRFDALESRYSLCRSIRQVRRTVRLHYTDHVTVLKPHGSLDWHLVGGRPVRCPVPLASSPLIITPGLNKFRGGYDPPFDGHRERANREIDAAARYLLIGYGFNDDHLQTHLEPQLRGGKPALLITRELTPRAKALLTAAPGMVALSETLGPVGTTVSGVRGIDSVPGKELWDLGIFIKEVLRP